MFSKLKALFSSGSSSHKEPTLPFDHDSVLLSELIRLFDVIYRSQKEYGWSIEKRNDFRHLVKSYFMSYYTGSSSANFCFKVGISAMERYNDVLVTEIKSPDSDFLKLPIDWQWNMSKAELSETEIKKLAGAY